MKCTLKFLLGLTLAIATILTTSCEKDNNDDTNNFSAEIVAGVGVKNVKIGDPAQKAFDTFGTVSDSYFGIGGQIFHFLWYLPQGIAVNLEPTNSETLELSTKIAEFVLSAPFAGKTDKGIGIGSTKTEVEAVYETPDFTDPLDGEVYNIGIAFEYDGANKVESITVFK